MADPDNIESQFLKQRHTMVEKQLRTRGINDQRVLSVMADVPRHLFIPTEHRHLAYDDRAIPIGKEQTISQPYMVAYMTELLSIKPTDRVLEIGTGSGYQTAILAKLAKHVFSVERIESLAKLASSIVIESPSSNVTIVVGDGSLGLPSEAPFDRILVTAAAPAIPVALTNQLVEDGILVLPIGGSKEQIVSRLIRKATRTIETPHLPCRFVKLIGQQGWEPS